MTFLSDVHSFLQVLSMKEMFASGKRSRCTELSGCLRWPGSDRGRSCPCKMRQRGGQPDNGSSRCKESGKRHLSSVYSPPETLAVKPHIQLLRFSITNLGWRERPWWAHNRRNTPSRPSPGIQQDMISGRSRAACPSDLRTFIVNRRCWHTGQEGIGIVQGAEELTLHSSTPSISISGCPGCEW